jgi:hypothetical protein
MATDPVAGPVPVRAFDHQDEVDRVRAALAGIDPDSQIAQWWGELRDQLEAGGMSPADAVAIAYRRARVAELLSEGVTDRGELARRVGCGEVTIRTDLAALRRLLEPRVTFVQERAA